MSYTTSSVITVPATAASTRGAQRTASHPPLAAPSHSQTASAATLEANTIHSALRGANRKPAAPTARAASVRK